MNDWDGTPKGILGLFRSESKLNRAQPSSIGSSAKQESALWSEFESWGRQDRVGLSLLLGLRDLLQNRLRRLHVLALSRQGLHKNSSGGLATQVFGERIRVAQDDQLAHQVLEFPDVARPIVRAEGLPKA